MAANPLVPPIKYTLCAFCREVAVKERGDLCPACTKIKEQVLSENPQIEKSLGPNPGPVA